MRPGPGPLLVVALAAAAAAALGREAAFVEVVLFESSPGGDYTTYTTGLQGRFSRAGATLSAEGEIVQVSGGGGAKWLWVGRRRPLSICRARGPGVRVAPAQERQLLGDRPGAFRRLGAFREKAALGPPRLSQAALEQRSRLARPSPGVWLEPDPGRQLLCLNGIAGAAAAL